MNAVPPNSKVVEEAIEDLDETIVFSEDKSKILKFINSDFVSVGNSEVVLEQVIGNYLYRKYRDVGFNFSDLTDSCKVAFFVIPTISEFNKQRDEQEYFNRTIDQVASWIRSVAPISQSTYLKYLSDTYNYNDNIALFIIHKILENCPDIYPYTTSQGHFYAADK